VNVDEQQKIIPDAILGRDSLYSLGFVLDFNKKKVKWNGISIPMSSSVKPRTFERKKVSEIRPRTVVRKNRTTHSHNNNYTQKSEPTKSSSIKPENTHKSCASKKLISENAHLLNISKKIMRKYLRTRFFTPLFA